MPDDGQSNRPDNVGTGSSDIGHFEVFADPEAIRKLGALTVIQAQTNDENQEHVPLTYPICWLGEPAVKKALIDSWDQLFDLSSHIPVHLSQNFDYSSTIISGGNYLLDLSIEGPDQKNRVQIEGRVRDESDTLVVTIKMDLIFVDAEGLAQ